MKRHVVTKVAETSPVTEEESFGASGDSWMVSSTFRRHTTTSPSPLKGLKAPSQLLAPEQVGLAWQTPSVLDKLEALLGAHQSALNQGMALVVPSLTLYILLAALLNPDFLQMDNTTSADTSD